MINSYPLRGTIYFAVLIPLQGNDHKCALPTRGTICYASV